MKWKTPNGSRKNGTRFGGASLIEGPLALGLSKKKNTSPIENPWAGLDQC